jgi:LCP family protein required for cell wall assembly
MHRYRMPPPPPRTTRQLLGSIFKWFLIVVVVVAVGLAGGAYLYTHETLNDFAPHHVALKKAAKHLTRVPDPSNPAIALMVGYDKRAGADASYAGSRSDTIMLVRADPQQHAVSMLSFPRDLLVPIECPNGSSGAVDRINSAWARCGPQGTLATVEALTGIHPNYLVTVDFHGFKLLVNKLGGVYLDVDHRYLNTQGGPYGYATIDLEPGYQKLDGQQALDFVRFRHTDSDLYRLARQQEFVTALKERVSSGFSIFTALHIIGALKGNVEIAQGGGGSISPGTALSFLKFFHGLPSGHFFRDSIDRNQLSGFDTLSAPQSAVQEAVQSFLHPNLQASSEAQNAALNIKPKPAKKKLKPSEITTLVLNGTTIAGLARDTSFKLANLGFHTRQLGGQQPANAPSQTYSRSIVYFDRSQPIAKQAASELVGVLGGAALKPLTPALLPFAASSGNPQTVVVLGSTFSGKLNSPTPVRHVVIKHEPPAVISSPGTTLAPLRQVARRLPFRVMVPHVIENRSNLAALEPIRVYKPAPHQRGLRITFVTGPGNVYWGIEETDWNNAPVLDHPNESRMLNGRHFDFYYSGAHLHMIVLRTPKASYWVVNTLLDELSNETMIAIARGLQPLGR